ncbi:MAG: hypothetical protein K9M15_01025 [Candidatus Marinimicrobia bacterium]|nr:hypothetical protein [Candidatus Neomarinimicrobiota bacterium]
MKSKILKLMPVALFAMPMMAMAANTLTDVITTIGEMIDTIIPILMTLVVAVFLWGIVKYVTAGGDAEKEKSARGYIIYGLIGIFVLVAFWGIVKMFASTFGVDTGGTLPEVEIPY